MKTSPKDKERMTKIGTMYGIGIYADTKDEKVLEHINNHINGIAKDSIELSKLKIEEEMKKFTQGFAYKKTK